MCFLHHVCSPLLLLAVFVSSGVAETFPPGKYDCSGRVVTKSNGETAVFWGAGQYQFPQKLQKQLKPYVGKFVRVDYTRISEQEAGIFSFIGSVIGRIDKITELAGSAKDLPVAVVAKPTKREFQHGEPIRVDVTITNHSGAPQHLQLGASHTSLCQDYLGKLVLEPSDHYSSARPYGLPAGPVLRTLQPEKDLRFTVTSKQMARPGNYQLVYCLSISNALGSQSEFADIVVSAPKNDAERKRNLRKWLTSATVGQRVQIAEQLLALGDDSGKTEILRMLNADGYSKPRYCDSEAFRFAWKHCGEEGLTAMMSLIRRQRNQDYALRMIENVYLSPERVELLKQLLACTHQTRRDISGWVDEPRVCDIAAAWLMGYTEGKMRFPRSGTEAQRDEAVAIVLKQLEQKPDFFHVLSDNYR